MFLCDFVAILCKVRAKYEAITTKTTDKYEGDITVKAIMTAETTSENNYCIVGKNVTLESKPGPPLIGINYNEVSIWSNYTAVCSYGDMTLDNNVWATTSGHSVPTFAILNGGNLLIKEHGNIRAVGGSYGIYANGDITMEG